MVAFLSIPKKNVIDDLSIKKFAYISSYSKCLNIPLLDDIKVRVSPSQYFG